jgi:xylulokinase
VEKHQGKMAKLSLGLDLSTQSLTASVLEIDTRKTVFTHTLDYKRDERLRGVGIRDDYIIPPRVPGEADQPPELFFKSLDAMFSDMKKEGLRLSDILVINNASQQHGHVYLNGDAQDIFSRLNKEVSPEIKDLVTLMTGSLAYGVAPIWRTSNTVGQADFVRDFVGGKERMILLSGSNAPLRFTGAIMRRVGEEFPQTYKATYRVQLLSSLIAGILAGNSDVGIDFGNACGMSLMNYRRRAWSKDLIKATAYGLPGGEKALRAKLPGLVDPDQIVGTISQYFAKKYGLDSRCKIVAGSGDNPQSKVLVEGDLLSLGTSFVNMVSTDGKILDMSGFANAMYDGVGRPFMFGCRTNGAMVWDKVRTQYGMEKDEYGSTEQALRNSVPGDYLFFWQPENESFPYSSRFEQTRIDYDIPNFKADYTGIIDSSLAAVYLHSKDFTRKIGKPLYVAGGATNSREVMRRVAAIWNRPIIPVEKGSAALGAAVAGAYALLKLGQESIDIERITSEILKRGKSIKPRPEDVAAYHGAYGYLNRFRMEEEKLPVTAL